ncbi:MAG: cobalt-precorrin-8 methylmutase [Methanobacteriaceae archaeon]|nr:cobalt-precorrin-8 methylmutase [Methanobacteriaceae archaeon]
MVKGSKSSKNDNFMGASTKQGYEIALKSRDIVKSLISDKISHRSPEERSIIERIVHSTADVEYASLTKMSSDFIQKSLESVKAGKDLLTDINMVKTGINKYEGSVECYINNAETLKLSKNCGITRAASAMRIAAMQGFEGMVVIGNSPTALFEVIKLVENDEMNVESVVGVPVGFVGAAESKMKLHKTDIPHLITEGPKGGTPVAVAVANSIIRLSKELL